MTLKNRIACTHVSGDVYPSKKSLSRIAIVRHRTVATDINTRLTESRDRIVAFHMKKQGTLY